MSDQPVFGTRELYDSLALALAADPAWADKGKGLTFAMTHVYTEPIDKSFFMVFEKGALVEVDELAAPGERPAEFVLTATPEVWERVLVSQTLSPNIALMTRKIKVEGKMGILMKNMGAFNHLLGVLTGIGPVLARD